MEGRNAAKPPPAPAYPHRLVEHVRTAQVESYLPKAGGTVLVLRGEHAMSRGRLIERHTKEARALVQLAQGFELVQCSFDDVSEWVGAAGEDADD